MRLDVILEIHHVVVGIRALERKDIGILTVNFNTGGSYINGLHAESGDGHDSHDSEHEGENQPLMLAQNQQVIVEVGLPRGEFKRRKARRQGDNLGGGAIGAIFTGYEFTFVGHF